MKNKNIEKNHVQDLECLSNKKFNKTTNKLNKIKNHKYFQTP